MPLFFSLIDFSSQDKNVQARLDEVAAAHEDVLASINQLGATLAEVQLHNYKCYWGHGLVPWMIEIVS